MLDPGVRAARLGELAIAKRIRAIYGKAKKEIQEIIQAYNLRFMAQDRHKEAQLKDGDITKQQYDDWLKRKVFVGKTWDEKLKHCTDVMTDANRKALGVIRDEQIGVYAENLNFQAYQIEKDLGMNLSFGIYDSNAVNLLLKKQPELLPRRVINGVKDRAWNKNKIAEVITRSIIKGDGIETVAKNLADALEVQNEVAMKRIARTAMGAAQNCGRMEMLREAQKKGIGVKKLWIATLDDRTRDAHRDLDGQTADVEEPFHVDLGKGKNGDIMCPHDPNADPSNVYNCRCTLGYIVDGVKKMGSRRAYYYDEHGYRKSMIIKNMTYREWEVWKRGQNYR